MVRIKTTKFVKRSTGETIGLADECVLDTPCYSHEPGDKRKRPCEFYIARLCVESSVNLEFCYHPGQDDE
jgi:hypothetical protein